MKQEKLTVIDGETLADLRLRPRGSVSRPCCHRE